MLRYALIIGGLAGLLALHRPTVAEASEPYTCIVFEDDSFACGTVWVPPQEASPGGVDWSIDRSKDWVSGCIPGGLCDNELTRSNPKRHRALPPR